MDDDTEVAAPPKSRVAAIAAVVALVAGAGMGYGGALFGAGSAEASEGEPPPVEAQAGEHAPAVAHVATEAVTTLGAFTVNLRGGGGGRVLRVEVQLETADSAKARVSDRQAQLRDSVITAVSDYTWSELEGTDGKTRLRDELLARVNGITAPVIVERLYFTQFVVQ